MGFFNKFKKKTEEKTEIPVPKPEEQDSTEEIRTKMDDVPSTEVPPALKEPEPIEKPKAEDFGVPAKEEAPVEKTDDQEPKAIEGLSLPEFEKEDAAKLPEEIPFEEISSGNVEDTAASSSEASEEPELPESVPEPVETPVTETPVETREVEDQIFIKVSDYKEILNNIANIKKEVKNSKNNIDDIVKNINFENQDIVKVKESLSSIQKSIISVDDELFEK